MNNLKTISVNFIIPEQQPIRIALEFEKLKIGRAIEQGKWRSFYEGTYLPDYQPVVVEVLNSLKGAPIIEIERFNTRAKNLAILNHPNISKILTHGEKDGLYYIAIEKEADVLLADHLSKGDYLPPIEATRLVLDMAYGLKAIHDLGFVHGNLRPTNIIFNEYGQVKMRNLFQFRQEKDFLLELVARRPHYVSPEHIRMNTVDSRSDQYMLGLMYYHILTGSPPYDATDVREIWRSHMEGELPELPENLKKIPRLDDVIKTLLAKNPKRRYPNDNALIATLENLEDALMLERDATPHNSNEHAPNPAKTKDKSKNSSLNAHEKVVPRRWNKGNACMLHSTPKTRRNVASSSEIISMLLISVVALLMISVIVLFWFRFGIDPHQDKSIRTQADAGRKVLIRTFKEMEAERLGKLESNGAYKKEFLVPKKANDATTHSANVLALTPKPNAILENQDQVSLEVRQLNAKLAILKSCLTLPKSESVPRIEAFLEDSDDKIRLIANQVIRDIKGGVLITADDLATAWVPLVDKVIDGKTVDQWLFALKKLSDQSDPQSVAIIKEAIEHDNEEVRHLALKMMALLKFEDFSEILLRQIKLRPLDRHLDDYSEHLKEEHIANLKTHTLNVNAREAVHLLPFWGKCGAVSTNFLGEMFKKRLDMSLPIALELAGMGYKGRELLIMTLNENPADIICNSALDALREVELDAVSLNRLEAIYGKLSAENNLYLSAILSSKGRVLEKAIYEPYEYKALMSLENFPKHPSHVELESIFLQLNRGNLELDLKILKILSSTGPLGSVYIGKLLRGKFPMELKRSAIDFIVDIPSPSSMALLLDVASDSQSRSELVKDIKKVIAKLGSKIMPVVINNEKLTAQEKMEYLQYSISESNSIVLIDILNQCSEADARRAIQVLLDAYPLVQGCFNTLLGGIKNSHSLQFLLNGLSSCGGEGGIVGTIDLVNSEDEFLSSDAIKSLKQRLSGDREEWHKAISLVNNPKIKAKMIANLTKVNPKLDMIVDEYIGFPDENCRKALIEKMKQLKCEPSLSVFNRLVLESHASIKEDLVKYLFSFEPPHAISLVWGREHLSSTAKKKIAQNLLDLSVNKKQISMLIDSLHEPYQLDIRLAIMRFLVSLDKDILDSLYVQLKEGDAATEKLFFDGMALIGPKSTAFLLKKLEGAKSSYLRNAIETVLKQNKIKYALNTKTGQYIVQ